MKTFLILFLLMVLTPFKIYGSDKLSQDILSIVLPFGIKKSPIRTSGCKYQKEKWGKLLLTKETFKEKILFSKECDLQGEFIPKIGEFFKLNLKVKNHKKIVETKINIKLEIIFEEMPLLNVTISKSTLLTKTKQNIMFKLTYGHYLDLLSKSPFTKAKGGVLTILKLGEKKINKSINI